MPFGTQKLIALLFSLGEFWQRTEARNRATAQLYDALGLQEYEAIEAFVMLSDQLNL